MRRLQQDILLHFKLHYFQAIRHNMAHVDVPRKILVAVDFGKSTGGI